MCKSALWICLAVIAFLSSQTAYAEDLRICATSTAQKNIFNKVQDAFEKSSGAKLIFVKPKVAESYSYLVEVLEGRADAAVAASTIENWTADAKKKGHTIPSDLTHRVIGFDTLNIMSHSSAGVTKLTFDQLVGVFGGTITNWKQVGGSDSPITVISYATKQSRNATVRKALLKDKPFGGKVKDVDGEEEDILKAIAATPGAIGFQTLDLENSNVTKIETPPIGRPITLVTKGAPSPNMQKLIGYIRDQISK